MRIAALYDIHGNLPALEAVLEEIDSCAVDLLVIGGDVVAGPMPRATLERLVSLRRPVAFVRGNADREVVDTFDEAAPRGIRLVPPELLRWIASQLESRHRDILASWPLLHSADLDGIGAVLFCHASPRNDTDIFTRVTPDTEIARLLEGVTQATVVLGHTHMQFERYVAGIRLLNAGSVGMPYGASGAHWLLLGPEVEFRCTAYDGEAAAAAICATEYPRAADFAANILHPPSEEQALAAFAQLSAGIGNEHGNDPRMNANERE